MVISFSTSVNKIACEDKYTVLLNIMKIIG